ncbi:hypothetical protein [Streptomyces sp. NPDC056921]|uniref:hypothetical protein n=1 Tax=Streptomyces sp. NPDC056921 TaxID=3345966 RepID=UPI0036451C6C
MSTPTLHKTETVIPTSTVATTKKSRMRSAKGQKESKFRTGWRRLAPKKEGGRFSLVVWAGLFRAVALVADCLLAFITAVVVIPLLGAWLHEQSGASQGALTAAGTIAMWLMPLLFLAALLAAGEIVLMRAMWRWATRTIAKIRDIQGDATRTNDQSRASRRRSK